MSRAARSAVPAPAATSSGANGGRLVTVPTSWVGRSDLVPHRDAMARLLQRAAQKLVIGQGAQVHRTLSAQQLRGREQDARVLPAAADLFLEVRPRRIEPDRLRALDAVDQRLHPLADGQRAVLHPSQFAPEPHEHSVWGCGSVQAFPRVPPDGVRVIDGHIAGGSDDARRAPRYVIGRPVRTWLCADEIQPARCIRRPTDGCTRRPSGCNLRPRYET